MKALFLVLHLFSVFLTLLFLLYCFADADLHIGKLMWGDSGLYYCLIITPDDVEGKTEESVELLVLGELCSQLTFPFNTAYFSTNFYVLI